jgi:hypothetical protein
MEVRRAEVRALFFQRKDSRPLPGSVNLRERLIVPAEAVEDVGAKGASSESVAVRRAEE